MLAEEATLEAPTTSEAPQDEPAEVDAGPVPLRGPDAGEQQQTQQQGAVCLPC